jgi:hypothetical protein
MYYTEVKIARKLNLVNWSIKRYFFNGAGAGAGAGAGEVVSTGAF